MMDRGRLEAFSDGVFAVAITLLALNLAVAGPGRDHHTLLYQLGHQWPAYVAYLVSFFTIGVIWVNHHALFAQVARVDRPLLFLNLLLLLFVVAIPFATSTVSDYLLVGGQDAHVAGALYAAVMEGMGLSFSLIFIHIAGHGLMTVPMTPEESRAATLRFGVGALVYLVAFGAAFISATLVLAIAGLITTYYIFRQTPGDAGPETSG